MNRNQKQIKNPEVEVETSKEENQITTSSIQSQQNTATSTPEDVKDECCKISKKEMAILQSNLWINDVIIDQFSHVLQSYSIKGLKNCNR